MSVYIVDMTTLTAAPSNSHFHSGNIKAKRERGERLKDAGNGMQRLYINGKYVALIPKES